MYNFVCCFCPRSYILGVSLGSRKRGVRKSHSTGRNPSTSGSIWLDLRLYVMSHGFSKCFQFGECCQQFITYHYSNCIPNVIKDFAIIYTEAILFCTNIIPMKEVKEGHSKLHSQAEISTQNSCSRYNTTHFSALENTQAIIYFLTDFVYILFFFPMGNDRYDVALDALLCMAP